MKLPRREFITSTGGTFIAYGFRFLPVGETPSQQPRFARFDNADEVCRYVKQNFDYHDWLLIGSNGTVTALTGRTEIGQGLETVIVALVSQALEIPPKAVDVVMGDTQLCPDDGATQGSSATRQVGWGFWQTALAASMSLRRAGAEILGLDPEQVQVRRGGVVSASDPSMTVGMSQLVVSSVVLVDLEPPARQELSGSYVDRELDDVRARDIVTGAQQYVGDLGPGGLLYGAYLRSPYHEHLSPLISADLDRARTVPGVAKVGIVRGRPAVIGDTYHAVDLGLMLDAFIFKELTQAAVFTGDYPTPHQVAGARRRFLGDLIEGQLGFEARHPTSLTISTTPVFGNARTIGEVVDWLGAQEERLLEEAPESIRAALEMNKLVRLQAKVT